MIEQPVYNINAVIQSHERFRGSRTAFVCGDRYVTWSEFEPRCNKVANALLDAGLKKGDKVGVLSLNSIENLEVILGTLRAGGVIVPFSAMLTPDLIASLVQDSGARFLFVASPLEPLTLPVLEKFDSISREQRISIGFDSPEFTGYEKFIASAAVDAPNITLKNEDECTIIYSSGTTGVPKGIVHTHMVRALIGTAAAMEFRIDSTSVTVISTPFFTNATWLMLLGTIIPGGTIVLMPAFTPENFFKAVQKERGTHTFLVPTQFQVILDHPEFDNYDLSSLRAMASMGSALPMTLKKRILKEIGNSLMELYGTTEGLGTTLKPEDILSKTGSVGTPVTSTDMRIIGNNDEELAQGKIGEIVGCSPAMMKEYHNRPEETKALKWYDELGRTFIRTGDMGRFDEDGFLYIMDRKKDMIVSGGVNVFANDIEEIFIQHPEVNEIAVIAIPHKKWIETPLALVKVDPDVTVKEDDLKDWANTRLAKHQRVNAVKFYKDEFPRNALGKLLKRKLREPYWKDHT